ncbi:MAG: glycosyltransferase [Desulfovibrio sp.]|jgi:glycosyltransferase involved in cell wall biosynthesis|nr:glycosyltransferase [Desulfovibrio sp.]
MSTKIRTGTPTVNITMVTWNRVNLTRLCLERLLSTKLQDYIIHVVDNGSTDETRSYISHLSSIHNNIKVIFLRKNYGVSVAANYGWTLTDSDYYVKLDNDVEILDDNWLDNLINFRERNKEVGLLGYRLLEKHKVTPVYLPSGDVFHEFISCGGGLILIPNNIHQQCGFWNEDYGYYGFTDLDYSNRVQILGCRVGYHFNEKAARHLGYDFDIYNNQEELKQNSVHDARKGEKLYLLNKFLFEEKIRSINVDRKFLPEQNKNSDISFYLNPKYIPITKLQNELLAKIKYTKDGDKVRLDFGMLKF